jgi:hypothetical protein
MCRAVSREARLPRTEADWVAWTREHRVAYELAPLLEMRTGDKVQSGFTLSLYAAAPMDKAAGAERQEAGRQLWEELRALAEAAVPAAERAARVELEPPRTAMLRPENEFKPEVGLTWQIYYPGDPRATTDADRERIAEFEKRLAALGLKRGRW